MYKIAIVEDDATQADLLRGYLERYGKEHACEFSVSCFFDIKTFLASERFAFDLVFMDIELPDGDGMDAVRQLRERDKKTLVIFVTNLAQYAIKGYEVKAFDFIVKPVAYYNFVLKMADALKSINLSRDVEVWIKTNEGMQKLYASQITYIEVIGHYLTYHTTDGDFVCNGSITNASDELRASSFSFCNRCYLVNLKYVTQITQTEVVVDGHRLILTRHKRANFVKDLNNFLAGGN